MNASQYVLGNLAKIVLMTSKYSAINSKLLSDSGLHFDSLLVDDCNLIPEIETLLAFSNQKSPSNLKRLVLVCHDSGGRPQSFNEKVDYSVTLIDRFISSGFSKTTHLSNAQSRSPWQMWKNGNGFISSTIFGSSIQFINISPILGKGEESPMRNYIQNLDEGEFAVALFQLLRLNGIPSKDIAILTAYKGQVDLIKEIHQNRCSWTDFYSEPAFIGTIDQSIGLHFKRKLHSMVLVFFYIKFLFLF